MLVWQIFWSQSCDCLNNSELYRSHFCHCVLWEKNIEKNVSKFEAKGQEFVIFLRNLFRKKYTNSERSEQSLKQNTFQSDLIVCTLYIHWNNKNAIKNASYNWDLKVAYLRIFFIFAQTSKEGAKSHLLFSG